MESCSPGENIAQIKTQRGDAMSREIVRLAAGGMSAEDIAKQINWPLNSVKISIGMRENQIEAERERLRTRRLDGTPIIHPAPHAAQRTPDISAPLPPELKPAADTAPHVCMVTMTGAEHTYVVTPGKVDIDGALSIPMADVEAIVRELESVLGQANAMGLV